MTRPVPNVGLPRVVEDTTEPLKERLSTWLDVAGGLCVAGGVSWGLFPVLGPYAVAIGGVIVIVLNLIAGWLRSRPDDVQPVPEPRLRAVPGPEDPGTVHVSGR
jgi:hypothetical protein